VLVGVTHDDTRDVATKLADKIYNLRILDGERSAADIGAPLSVVSQFTLYAGPSRGRRPSWNAAAPSDIAQPLVDV
jgi:D-aminoacyl-tRNA deacylase